jgi:hypothetical protein
MVFSSGIVTADGALHLQQWKKMLKKTYSDKIIFIHCDRFLQLMDFLPSFFNKFYFSKFFKYVVQPWYW